MDEHENTWTTADDAYFHVETLDEHHPFKLAAVFMTAIENPEANEDVLRGLVTPESWASWGDFSSIRDYIESNGDTGFTSSPRVPEDAPDVCYLWTLAEGMGAKMITTPTEVLIVAFWTFIWRPELGGWKLHMVSGDRPPIDAIPRTSPGDAPTLDNSVPDPIRD